MEIILGIIAGILFASMLRISNTLYGILIALKHQNEILKSKQDS